MEFPPLFLLSPWFSLFPTLGYYPALGFLFFPPLAVIQPQVLHFSHPWLLLSPWFSTFTHPWLYPALGLYSEGESNLFLCSLAGCRHSRDISGGLDIHGQGIHGSSSKEQPLHVSNVHYDRHWLCRHCTINSRMCRSFEGEEESNTIRKAI